jgi:TPR repeat protein
VLDEETAVKWRQLAAEGDDVEGKHRLGQLYEGGELGLEPGEEEALKWYRKAANGGSTKTQTGFGKIFNGNVFEGALIDKEEALKWLRNATKGNEWSCQWLLGLAYEHGYLADYLVSHIHFGEAAFARKARELRRLDVEIDTSETL